MILEIALGIVLGVVILRYWQPIVALGLFAAVGAILFIIAGIVIYWIATNEPLLEKILTISIVFTVYLIGLLVSKLIAKRTVLKEGEIGVLLTITVFLIIATSFFFPFITKWATDANKPELFLFLLPLLGIWTWTWLKLSSLLKTRHAELSGVNTET